MSDLSTVDLVGVGLNATDTVIPLVDFPVRGSKVEFRNTSVLPGGQVATTVVACQSWGLKTRYIGKLGEDDAARIHRLAFAAAGVETHLLTVPGGSSAQSIILVDSGGERTVLGRRDDRLILKPSDLDRDWITSARALHVDGYDTEAATIAATWARAAGIPVIADLDELYPGVEDLLRKVDYLIASRDFPCRLMAENNLERALFKMQARFGGTLTAATLGEGGVLAYDGRQFLHTAAFQVPVVDTTGAGDIFHAGFIFGLLQGWTLERQLDFACAAAALNCRSVGARGGVEPLEVIEGLIRTGTRYPVPSFVSAAR